MENKQKEWDIYSLYLALFIEDDGLDFVEKIDFDTDSFLEKIYGTEKNLYLEELKLLAFEFNFLNYQQSKKNYKNDHQQNFLVNLILNFVRNLKRKKFNTWLEFLELKRTEKLKLKYFYFNFSEEDEFFFIEEELLNFEPICIDSIEEEEEEEEEYEEEGEYEDGVYIDKFELARRRRKQKQKIFDIITWGIALFSFLSTFYLVFFWEMRFIEYIIYITSLWIDVYIIIAINYFKLKDLPRPFLSSCRITL